MVYGENETQVAIFIYMENPKNHRSCMLIPIMCELMKVDCF